MKEFKAFLMRGNVVELAVAVVIGAKVKDIVDAIVSGLVTPLIGIISGDSFAAKTFTIRGSDFAYGKVIDAVISFVAVAAVVFFLIVKPMNTLIARRRAGEESEAPEPTTEELLTEIRDLLAARQA